jgi:hemoglobin
MLDEIKGIVAGQLSLSWQRAVLKKYLAEWLGGAPAYSQERDAWMFCMRGAMEEAVADEVAREWILQKLSSLADWMRNRSVSGNN